MSEKFFKCFSLKLLSYLTSQGFVPVGQREDLKNPNMKIWLFNNNEDIQVAYKNYCNK